MDILTKNNSSLQLYVNNGKGESVLYQNNSIDVNEGDLISIYAGETSEKEAVSYTHLTLPTTSRV